MLKQRQSSLNEDNLGISLWKICIECGQGRWLFTSFHHFQSKLLLYELRRAQTTESPCSTAVPGSKLGLAQHGSAVDPSLSERLSYILATRPGQTAWRSQCALSDRWSSFPADRIAAAFLEVSDGKTELFRFTSGLQGNTADNRSSSSANCRRLRRGRHRRPR